MRGKSKYGMLPPQTRSEFEHNVFLTLEEIEQNKDNPDHLQNIMWAIGDSLEVAKKLPNNRIALTTIDEMLRLHSNMLDWMRLLPKEFSRGAVNER